MMNWNKLLQALICTVGCFVIMCATDATGSWDIETLDSDGDVGT